MKQTLLFLSIIFIFFISRETKAQNADSLALVSIYESSNGAGWQNNTNWLTGNLNTWHGVSINTLGRVDSLNLESNNLTGVIPAQIGDLTALEYLNFFNNSLTGILPPEMGNLIALQGFDLRGNKVEGTIPAELFDLRSISFLGLDGNNFTELPEIDTTYSIQNKTLSTLNISNNYLTFEDYQLFDARDTIQGYIFGSKPLIPTYDSMLAEGSSITLSFQIGGTGNTYQWYRNGEPITGATTDMLTIDNFSIADQGKYVLEAQNADVPQMTLSTDDFFLGLEGAGLPQGPKWTKAFSFGGLENTLTSAIEVDNDKNILIYGEANGNFDFLGRTIDTTASGSFLAKMDQSYNLISLINIAGGYPYIGIGDFMVYDESTGDTYLAGKFVNSVTIGTLVLTSSNPDMTNSFAARINSNGEPVWIKEFPQGTTINDLSVKNNEVVISGLYSTNVTLEGKFLAHQGGDDFFVAKYNPDGTNLFIKTVAGASAEYLVITAIDGQGNIYTTSEATSDTLIYEDETIFPMAEGSGNVLVIKYDPLGNRVWEKTYSGSPLPNGDYYSWPTAITVDPFDNPVLIGWFGTKNGFGADTLTSPYQYNKFITQLAPDGSVNWATPILEESYGWAYNELETDQQGNIYFMTEKRGAIYIDGFKYPLEGTIDAYVVKYGNNGVPGWIKEATSMGSPYDIAGLGVVEEDILYLGGKITGTQFKVGEFTLSTSASHGFVASIGGRTLAHDSSALAAIYNSTNGDNWRNNANWLTTDLSPDWFGVTIENNRVTGISLPGNNLSGRIPEDINLMDSLSVIEFQDNKLTSIPDMSGPNNISLLDVSGNRLEFGSLEANSTIPGINYQNQDSIGNNIYWLLPVGSDTTVQVSTSGSANFYQWYYEGQPITGSRKDSIGIIGINKSNMGKYYVEVRNEMVPGLVLTSRIKEVLATAALNGQVRLSDATPLPDGDVKLLKIKATNGFDTTNIAAVDANGLYQMNSVVLGDYILVGIGDTATYRDHLPTYYTNSIFWEEADTLIIEANLSVDIDLVKFENMVLSGDGVITGAFEEDIPEGGRIAVRKRIRGASVSVRRGRRSGRKGNINSRMLETHEPVAIVYTNENGEFTFKDLEPDTYTINFQYPGYPMDTATNFDLVIGDTYRDRTFSITGVAQNNKITVTAEAVVGVDGEIAAQISVYPNPTDQFLNISFGDLSQNQCEIYLFDNKGQEVQISTQIEANNIVLDLKYLPSGIYILQVFDEEQDKVISAFKVAVSK